MELTSNLSQNYLFWIVLAIGILVIMRSGLVTSIAYRLIGRLKQKAQDKAKKRIEEIEVPLLEKAKRGKGLVKRLLS